MARLMPGHSAGGDGGSRTRVRNICPVTSTSLVAPLVFHRADSVRQGFQSPAEPIQLRRVYRRTPAAAQQFMSAYVRPESGIGTGRDPCYGIVCLPTQPEPCSGCGGKQRSCHCWHLYVLRLFNVADALRLAITELPAPSKPFIPIRCKNTIAQMSGKCKNNEIGQ